jgi:hypothetical protein
MVIGAGGMYPSLIGSEFGGYQILAELATGGMGTVYLGQRMGLGGFGQPAAIKLIHPHLAGDRSFVEMFIDEAHIASRVRHPNVCAVLDFGKANGTFYLVMEYLPGETWARTLSELTRDTRLRRRIPQVIAYVIAQACEGLHAAHEAVDARGAPLRIVHRDVSPQNLLVGYDGGVRVLDFGVASAAERLHTTRIGTVKGRYAYMSPEQMLGGSVDARSDVWSLGVLLREGLTGTNAFRRPTDAETIAMVTHRLVPAWERRVHPALRRIADKAMAWDPAERHQNARELGSDLLRFVHQHGGLNGMAELSGSMHRLFAEKIREKSAVLRRAANDDRASAPLSLPPAATLQEEITTLKYRGGLAAEETTARGFDPEAETWEREPRTIEMAQPREKRTTQELFTFTVPAPAREGGRFSAMWLGLSSALAMGMAALWLGTPHAAPSRAVQQAPAANVAPQPARESATQEPAADACEAPPTPVMACWQNPSGDTRVVAPPLGRSIPALAPNVFSTAPARALAALRSAGKVARMGTRTR